MEYGLVGLLIIFLVYLYFQTKKKAEKITRAVMNEKRAIADESGMTASIGVFTPDLQTTVVIGASEELGYFYYRMLKQAKLINKSRISLANLSRIEFLLNGNPQQLDTDCELPTTTLCAADIADRTLSQYTNDSIRQVQRAALRVVFYDESGLEKTLEITTFRQGDERHKLDRVPLLKNTIWWAAFLQIASRKARRVRAQEEQAAQESPQA